MSNTPTGFVIGMSTTHQKLDELFPVPSLPPSQLSPQRLPGANLESLAALQGVLKDNHQRHHIFFNDIKFHKYVSSFKFSVGYKK
jgi:hypothetical protein